MALKKLKNKKNKRKLYRTAGMYNNTIPAGLSTMNIVQEESDPKILEASEDKLNATTAALQQASANASDKIKQDEAAAEQQVELAGQTSTAGVEAGVSGLKNITEKFVKPENRVNPLSDAITTYRGVRAANLAAKAQKGIDAGVQTFKQAQQGAKALELASKTSKIPATIAAPQTVGTLADASTKASAIGAGLKNFATSGAGIGTIASLAGRGISKLSDDDDATTLNFGEGAGATLSGIGTGLGAAALAGAVMGSAVPVVGNLIGAGVGALYGLGKSIFSTRKAKKEERELEAKRDRFRIKSNKKTAQKFSTALGQQRAAQLKSKMASGYNLGANTTAKLGGLRLGIPRYGN